jgi:hypothetical protein
MFNDQLSRLPVRCLTAYTSADGQPPSGIDDSVDDGPAIQAAIAEGPGVIRIPPGYYRWSEVRVPAGVTLAGAADATIIRACNDQHPIFDQSGVGNWSIRDLVLDGEAPEPWRQRRDLGRVGLSIHDAWAFNVDGLTVRDFSGSAVHISHVRLDPAAFCHGGLISRLTAVGNAVGVCFDERGEYVTLTDSHIMRNTTGCIIHAGNTKITQCNIGSNIVGVVIADKQNGSHGVIGNCLINHNEQYALDCRGVVYGMIINACGIFYGGIRLRDCMGVQIANCQVSCPVTITGEHANAFVDNMLIEEGYTFEFSESTIIRGNFTAAGDWPANRALSNIPD